MVNQREYFTVELKSQITLGIPLDEMGTVVQFDAANVCTVPGVADFWYGVANHKGSLLWILDSDRFFSLEESSSRPSQKLTAVIIRNQNFSRQKQVAITAEALQGIMELEVAPGELMSGGISPQLAQCCSSIAVTTGNKSVHILNSAALLQQLYQQSTLVST